tara:strand:+ start:673 stop:1014 length:342 start_codon:yes stop_codon:yes gene_type:complete
MKNYTMGLLTGMFFSASVMLFIGARTVNVKKKEFGHIVVKSITIKDGENKINIYPESIILKNKSFNETVIKPEIISIENYENNYRRELSLSYQKMVFKKNGNVNFFLPPAAMN